MKTVLGATKYTFDGQHACFLQTEIKFFISLCTIDIATFPACGKCTAFPLWSVMCLAFNKQRKS